MDMTIQNRWFMFKIYIYENQCCLENWIQTDNDTRINIDSKCGTESQN